MALEPSHVHSLFSMEIDDVRSALTPRPGQATSSVNVTPVTEGVYGVIPSVRARDYWGVRNENDRGRGVGDNVIQGQVASIQYPDLGFNERELPRYFVPHVVFDSLKRMEATFALTAWDSHVHMLLGSHVRISVYSALDDHRAGGTLFDTSAERRIMGGIVKDFPGPEIRYNQDNELSFTMEVRQYDILYAPASALLEANPEYEQMVHIDMAAGEAVVDNVDIFEARRRALGLV